MEPRQHLRSSSSPVLIVAATSQDGHHWATERFLSLPPGRGTVCHQQSVLHQPCIHSVEPQTHLFTAFFPPS